METGQPLMIAESSPEVAERYGNPWILVGEPIKSALFVPLIMGGKATGVISLQNIDRVLCSRSRELREVVVLADEEHRQCPQRGEVDGLVERAL